MKLRLFVCVYVNMLTSFVDYCRGSLLDNLAAKSHRSGGEIQKQIKRPEKATFQVQFNQPKTGKYATIFFMF